MIENIEMLELPQYSTILLKDTKGERYTYHDARAWMDDDDIHIYFEDNHVVFNKRELTMFVLRAKEVDTKRMKDTNVYIVNAETGELEEVNAYEFFLKKSTVKAHVTYKEKK